MAEVESRHRTGDRGGAHSRAGADRSVTEDDHAARIIPPSDTVPAPQRAGRDLPSAIAVGVGLGLAVLIPLLTFRWLFAVVVLVAVIIGTLEMIRSLTADGTKLWPAPLVGGEALMIGLAWWGGLSPLLAGLLITIAACAIWRLFGPIDHYPADVFTAALIAVYVGFLAGFCVALAVPADGAARVIVFALTVVCSDVGGYAVGVIFGRHPMAPTISPKKSWEGFAGSLILCAVAGAYLFPYAFKGADVSMGVVFGLCIACAATLGDFGESMIKRDLGVKDMGTLLPGHGGVMDRLDSLLIAAPVAYLLLTAMVPPT